MTSIVHMITDQDWASRTAENRLGLVAREASRRLHGMHDILYGLAMSNQACGGKNFEHLTFLGSAAMDLSKALGRAHEEAFAEAEAADEARPARRAAKKAATAPMKKRGA